MLQLFFILSAICLVIMLIVDYLIGQAAEFFNAWSVVERLLGMAASAGNSYVYTQLGAVGELIVVLLANLCIGGLLTLAIGFFIKNPS